MTASWPPPGMKMRAHSDFAEQSHRSISPVESVGGALFSEEANSPGGRANPPPGRPEADSPTTGFRGGSSARTGTGACRRPRWTTHAFSGGPLLHVRCSVRSAGSTNVSTAPRLSNRCPLRSGAAGSAKCPFLGALGLSCPFHPDAETACVSPVGEPRQSPAVPGSR